MQAQAVHGLEEQAQQDARHPPRFPCLLGREIIRRWRNLSRIVRICIVLLILFCIGWIVASQLWKSDLDEES
ncbi:hypothetical protein PT974_10468 [Cladobotryum mycophilum]|uniref:Uncharacterized protein n=1 Tax=Cladobotryum mycophilum TaxID=491253 RepID=A0ABR0SAZ9_9HYPO